MTLDPIRARLLSALAEPGSASTVAATTGLTRQHANYHLKTLEKHGLIELVEERRKGSMTERVLQATAASYVISPRALGVAAPDPDLAPDELSARWLIALASRMVGEVGQLLAGASAAGKPLATYAVDSHIRFGSAADRAAFATELSVALAGLVSKYHQPDSPRGREHRFVAGLHPSITRELDQPAAAAAPAFHSAALDSGANPRSQHRQPDREPPRKQH